jgi:uracil-DNA glycosylase
LSLTPELEMLIQQINACTECALCQSRNKAVPGEGPLGAPIMLIGEAPGWHENQQGRPFVGPAGMFLEELLASIGFKRSEVFIANVVKCRPPANRDPLPEEIAACAPYLARQLELVKPQMIVTLGRFSMARFFKGETIGKVHGTSRRVDGLLVYAMYHPAAALHQGSLRKTIEADMLKIPGLLAEAQKQAEAAAEEQEPAQQLALF